MPKNPLIRAIREYKKLIDVMQKGYQTEEHLYEYDAMLYQYFPTAALKLLCPDLVEAGRTLFTTANERLLQQAGLSSSAAK